MGKKKYNPHKEIEECCSTLRTTPSKWIHHRDYGCNDPFWADGCNMNLLRNHMIYAKNRIQSVCQGYGILPPEELNIPIPPYVDENYFADPNCDRAKKYQMFGSCRNHHTPCSLAEMKAYKIQSENKQEEYKQLQLF